jgi:trigger factor
MQTQLEQLDGDRVRLTVEIPAHDVHHAVEHAANDLAATVKVPGFRKGKVPVPVLVSRLGKERIYAEAVETHIGGWFWNAASSSHVQPAEPPEYAYELPASDDKGWQFTAEFAVQPKPEPADWSTLEVPKLEIDVPPEAIQEQLEALQRSVAEIVPAEGRAAQDGDVVVIDLASESEAQRDVIVELGVGQLIEEIENGVRGLGVGESREVAYELGDESQRRATITVKEIKEKVLAPLDDGLARAASEFDSLAELRADIERRIREELDEEIDGRFRAAAVDVLVRATDVRTTGFVVESRTRELINRFVRSLQSRGIDVASYLQLTGQTPESLEQQLRAEALSSVARELVLEAVADKLGIEITDADIRVELEQAGEPQDAIEDFFAHGGADRVRDTIRMRRAVDRIAAEVKPITVEQATEKAEQEAARESIWTPEKDRASKETTLWTPGSPETR